MSIDELARMAREMWPAAPLRLLLLCTVLGACGRSRGMVVKQDGGRDARSDGYVLADGREKDVAAWLDGSQLDMLAPAVDVASGDGPARLDGIPVDVPAGGIDVASGDGPAGIETLAVDAAALDAGGLDVARTACGRAPAVYQGALCGPPTRPCIEYRRETVSADWYWRNDAPSLALHPAREAPFVLFSVAEGGYHGYLGQRADSGAWQVTGTTDSLAAGALLFDPSGTGWAVFYDGSGGAARLWEWNGAWLLRDSLPARLSGGAHSFARDLGGCMHAAVMLSGTDPVVPGGVYPRLPGYARRADGWTAEVVADLSEPYPSSLVLSPSGRAHLGLCVSDKTYLVVPPAPPEEVGTCGLDPLVVRLAVTEVDGVEQPHLFYSRVEGAIEAGAQIAHASRRDGSWLQETIVPASPASLCSSTPTSTSPPCAYDYVEHWPLAALAGAQGQVRLLFTTLHRTATMVAQCSQGAVPRVCWWQSTSYKYESRLGMAWVEGGVAGYAPVIESFTASAATMAVDSTGRIHVAVYDRTGNEGSSATAVRYLLLGSTAP